MNSLIGLSLISQMVKIFSSACFDARNYLRILLWVYPMLFGHSNSLAQSFYLSILGLALELVFGSSAFNLVFTLVLGLATQPWALHLSLLSLIFGAWPLEFGILVWPQTS